MPPPSRYYRKAELHQKNSDYLGQFGTISTRAIAAAASLGRTASIVKVCTHRVAMVEFDKQSVPSPADKSRSVEVLMT